MRALRKVEAGPGARLEDVPIPTPGPGEVLMTGAVYHAMADMVQSELTTQSAVRGRSGRLEIYRMALLGGRGDLA